MHDSDEDVNRDSDPNLAFDRVLGGPEERFDAQVLLDPLEEQFNLPAILVEIRLRLRWNGEVVGQEVERLAGLNIVVADTA